MLKLFRIASLLEGLRAWHGPWRVVRAVLCAFATGITQAIVVSLRLVYDASGGSHPFRVYCRRSVYPKRDENKKGRVNPPFC